MKGNELFRKVYPLLKVISYLFYIFPKPILMWFWIVSDLFPSLLGIGLRYIIALRLSKKLGQNVFFGRCIEIKNWDNLEIGNNVSIHKDCYIDASGGLEIGNDVSIAHDSSILTSTHTWMDKETSIRWNEVIFSRVIIKNDVWIGCGRRILSGVTIESRSIIAAGAVVINNVDKCTIVGGVPAKKIKKVN